MVAGSAQRLPVLPDDHRQHAKRPWMPCPGNHEVEFYEGPTGEHSYLIRYGLPDNGVPGFRGHWYSFRVARSVHG